MLFSTIYMKPHLYSVQYQKHMFSIFLQNVEELNFVKSYDIDHDLNFVIRPKNNLKSNFKFLQDCPHQLYCHIKKGYNSLFIFLFKNRKIELFPLLIEIKYNASCIFIGHFLTYKLKISSTVSVIFSSLNPLIFICIHCIQL